MKDYYPSKNALLTVAEYQFLKTAIAPFKSHIKFIYKQEGGNSNKWEYLCLMLLEVKSSSSRPYKVIALPDFKARTAYKRLAVGTYYTLSDLHLD